MRHTASVATRSCCATARRVGRSRCATTARARLPPARQRPGPARHARASRARSAARWSPSPGPKAASASPRDSRCQAARAVAGCLIADDQELVRDGFRMILEASGIEVVGEAARRARGDRTSLARRRARTSCSWTCACRAWTASRRRCALAGPGVADPIAVLILTTFDLDEYVLEALRAGASGFLLKDAGRDQLVSAVHAVARGDALIAPSVNAPADQAIRRRAHRRHPLRNSSELTSAGARRASVHRPRALQRRARQRPDDQRGHRQDPRRTHPEQAARSATGSRSSYSPTSMA